MFLLPLGITVNTPSGLLCAHAIMILAVPDLPARAIVMNMKHFNGKFACCRCEDEGETESGKPLHRWWPFQQNSIMRTHDSMMQNAIQATTSGDAAS